MDHEFIKFFTRSKTKSYLGCKLVISTDRMFMCVCVCVCSLSGAKPMPFWLLKIDLMPLKIIDLWN